MGKCRCHPDDRSHKTVQCKRPCTQLVPGCGHPCQKTCSEECTPCRLLVDLTLPCGHAAKAVPCIQAQTPTGIRCSVRVEVRMEHCGHTVTVACSDAQKVGLGFGVKRKLGGDIVSVWINPFQSIQIQSICMDKSMETAAFVRFPYCFPVFYVA